MVRACFFAGSRFEAQPPKPRVSHAVCEKLSALPTVLETYTPGGMCCVSWRRGATPPRSKNLTWNVSGWARTVRVKKRGVVFRGKEEFWAQRGIIRVVQHTARPTAYRRKANGSRMGAKGLKKRGNGGNHAQKAAKTMVPKVGLEPTWVSPTVFETAEVS